MPCDLVTAGRARWPRVLLLLALSAPACAAATLSPGAVADAVADNAAETVDDPAAASARSGHSPAPMSAPTPAPVAPTPSADRSGPAAAAPGGAAAESTGAAQPAATNSPAAAAAGAESPAAKPQAIGTTAPGSATNDPEANGPATNGPAAPPNPVENTPATAGAVVPPEASESASVAPQAPPGLPIAPDEPPATPPAFALLGAEIPAGSKRQVSWYASQNYSGIDLGTPVLVAHGTQPGPVLCVTAAVHGDEINGVEMARRVFQQVDIAELHGTLLAVPIVNLHGFERSYRYLADRRDLNRYFPGSPEGSSAARIAHSFFNDVIGHCDALVDLHTGSFHRTNLPQLRADLSNPEVVKLTQGFGATAVLRSRGARGTLRRAATEAGIPSVALEAGEPMRFQPDEVRHGVKAISSLMAHLGMTKKSWSWRAPQPVYYDSFWVRAGQGGILFALVKPGDSVTAGQLLGTITDPITNARERVLAPQSGRILGLAVNQMVMPGFALFRVGTERTEAQVVQSAEAPAPVAPPSSTVAPGSPVVPPPAPGDGAPAVMAPEGEIANPPAPVPPNSAAPRASAEIPEADDEAENGGEEDTDHADE